LILIPHQRNTRPILGTLGTGFQRSVLRRRLPVRPFPRPKSRNPIQHHTSQPRRPRPPMHRHRPPMAITRSRTCYEFPLAIRPNPVTLRPPFIRGRCLSSVNRITTRSPLTHRRAVYRLARYFQREMRYDIVQYGYDGEEDDPDHVAFLWVHPEAA